MLAVIENVCYSNLVCVCRTASFCTLCGRRDACALEILVCCSFVESGVHALRVRTQYMWVSCVSDSKEEDHQLMITDTGETSSNRKTQQ